MRGGSTPTASCRLGGRAREQGRPNRQLGTFAGRTLHARTSGGSAARAPGLGGVPLIVRRATDCWGFGVVGWIHPTREVIGVILDETGAAIVSKTQESRPRLHGLGHS